MKYFINYISAYFIARKLLKAFEYASVKLDDSVTPPVKLPAKINTNA